MLLKTENYTFYNWKLSSISTSVPNASIHIDKLSMSFDENEILTYLKKKESDIESDKLDTSAFEQILAHEAFHVYQTLTCSLLSDYSLHKRKESLLLLRLLHRKIEKKQKISASKKSLYSLFDYPESREEKKYFYLVREDRVKSKKNLDTPIGLEKISVRDVIEGGAVAFQLLSKNDIRNIKVQLVGEVYSKAWNLFSKYFNYNYDDNEQLKYARLTFLFLTDIYLKTKSDDTSYSESSFEDCIHLITDLSNKVEDYKRIYNDPIKRDSAFIESIQYVERDKQRVQKILDFIGKLPSEDYQSIFINVSLYADLFKRLVLVGYLDRKTRFSNKHFAANCLLENKFPFWGSHLTIPCILSNQETSIMFSMLWVDLPKTKFIDDTRKQQISFSEENALLDLFDRLVIATLPKADSNKQIFCCKEHGLQSYGKVNNCNNKDSLNYICQQIFGKQLKEIIQHDR